MLRFLAGPEPVLVPGTTAVRDR